MHELKRSSGLHAVDQYHLGGGSSLPDTFCFCIFSRIPPLLCFFSVGEFYNHDPSRLPIALKSFRDASASDKCPVVCSNRSRRKFFIFFISARIMNLYINNKI